MDILYKSLKIPRNRRIYHINCDEYEMKRIFRTHLDQKRDIIYFSVRNRMNIDIVFISNSYIPPKEMGNRRSILIKDHYKENHALNQVFFGSLDLLANFKIEKKNNPNAFMSYCDKAYGSFFIGYYKKEKVIFSCFKNNNTQTLKTSFQFDMFSTTKHEEEILDNCKRVSRENEDYILKLMS